MNLNQDILPNREISFDPILYRKDFPILNREVNGTKLVYLDNAASMQMPQVVIDSFVDYQSRFHANVHRGVHTLSQEATDKYEAVRSKIRDLIHAKSENEIIYTYGTTDALNMVASTYGRQNISTGDEILISEMEHHANIVPWYMLAKEVGAIIKVIPITDSGEINMDAYTSMLSNRTKIVAVTHVSNALGTINPVKTIAELAHQAGAIIVVDGAQAVPHAKVDVQDLNCDFYAFSAHKMCGPTGLGVLYGKFDILNSMPPYRGGGDMIKSVTFEHIIFNDVPFKFEAGTPPISQVIMFGESIDYVNNIGIDRISEYESELLSYATKRANEIEGLTIIGTAVQKASVLSFTLKGIHPHDIGTILDQSGVAVRTGHHCAQPVMDRFNVPATTRASFAFYNTFEEVDELISAIHQVKEVFG
ncbi:MAG TPA: cysteine desulfurase CsdA [Bacteroidetes bacterium]|nr:cysteine desulfurase CsdA [Bacteroidota bacterium]